ncbi:class I SAM-dependent methyltransferase [Nocardioides yefusunii]|uniref:Class I SAM-dependent methyltransferase n=1 Tax=Nocardioides yefusunii TaxID=2500546 RepID=A0ABW1QW20_9ACTN|nr:class I SAM-dependent methyltransferase [Nocardioides yefusunii]
MDIALRQRRRAGLEFLGSVQNYAGKTLQAAAGEAYRSAVPQPPLDLDSRRASVYEVLEGHSGWEFDRFLTRWVAEEIYVRALPAIEEKRDSVEAWLDVKNPVGSLTLNPEMVPPAYWEGGFHLAPGGWDGHDLMGPAISELVFAYVLTPGGVGAVKAGENLMSQRDQVAGETPRTDYKHVVELGASSGRFTFALKRRLPNSKITAVELSASALKHGHALASDKGVEIDFVHAPAEATGLPDGCADLVAAYTLMHEVPVEENLKIVAEMFRLLEPGGHLLISEIAPYEHQDAFRSVVLDWETENRGEPYWRQVMDHDWAAELAAAGFVDIEAYGVGGGVYPWVTRATKPAV